MCDALHINSLKQCPTPLNTLFFSEFNMNLLQRGIRQDFKNRTGISIDKKYALDTQKALQSRLVEVENEILTITDRIKWNHDLPKASKKHD